MAGDLLPYFKVFPAETLADERFSGWTMEERGVWFTLLLHAWVNGSIPADPTAIARVIRMEESPFRETWKALRDRFISHPEKAGRLTSRRLEIEREEAVARSKAGRVGAKSRWAKDSEDATAERPQSDRNAEPMRHAMPFSAAQRSAEQRDPEPEKPAPPSAWDRVNAEWLRVCVPAGYASARGTKTQQAAAAARMRDGEWFAAFQAACAFLASEPWYRGENDRGWAATLGWILEKPNRAEKLAERGATKRPNGATNGRTDPDQQLLAAFADAERYHAAGKPEAGGNGDDGGAGCSPPLSPAPNDVAPLRAALPPALRAAVVRGR